MKYHALIFDMDGTIVDNMSFHNQALLETLVEAGARLPSDLNEIYRAIYGKKTDEILGMFLGPGLSAAEVARWGERKDVLYRQYYSASMEALPGLLSLMEQARAQGVCMAVASAAPPGNINFVLDQLNLRPFFQAVVSGEDVQHSKPQPDIFLKAASNLGVKPEDCLVFEDALSGIEAARRAGMAAVMITTTISAQEVAGQAHVLCSVPDFTYLDLPSLQAGVLP